MINVEKLINPQQSAEILGCHKNLIYKLVEQGDLKATRIGQKMMIFADSINEYITGNTVAPTKQQSIPEPAPMRRRKSNQQNSSVKNKSFGFPEGSIYQKGPSWYISFRDEKNERVQMHAKGAITRADAYAFLKTQHQKVRAKAIYGQNDITLSEFKDEYDRHLRRVKKKKELYIKSDIRRIGSLLIPHFGADTNLSDITSKEVSKYVDKRLATGITGSTVNRELMLLSGTLRTAKRMGYSVHNDFPVVPHLHKQPENPSRNRVMTEEEEESLLIALPKHARDMVVFAVETAMRLGEILKLKWDNVNLKERIITVPGEITKNGETRYVPISDRLAPVLLERHSVFQHLSEYVFIYRDPKTGEYNPIGSIKNSFTSGCRRAGIEGLRFHDLRHTAGTRWINEGIPQITVQRIMGHKGAEMSNIYINLSARDLRESFLGK